MLPVDAGGEVEAAPVARRRRRVAAVVGRVERPARSVAVVEQRREDDRVARPPLGDQLGADLDLDPAVVELDDDARIDRQPGVQPGVQTVAVAQRGPARRAADDQVLGDHVDDVGVVESRRHRKLVDRLAGLASDPHEQAVDAVVDQQVAVDVRPDAVVVGGERRRPGTSSPRSCSGRPTWRRGAVG